MDIRPILSTLRRHKTAAALIVLEVALTCAIVCNALFLVSQRVEKISMPSGIAESELVMLRVSGIGKQTDAMSRTREDLASLRAIPGVSNVTIINQVPFRNGSSSSSISRVIDQERPTTNASMYTLSENGLATMGINLIAGRDFLPDEYQNFEDVSKGGAKEKAIPVILTQATAAKMEPNGSALGKTYYMGKQSLHVVGIVDTLSTPNGWNDNWTNSMLLPIRVSFDKGGTYVLRTSPERRQEVLDAGAAALERNDPNRLMRDKLTYEDQRKDFFKNDRAMVGLLITVSISLLVVTALGIIGLASFWVQQRSKQIGIRRALGATRGHPALLPDRELPAGLAGHRAGHAGGVRDQPGPDEPVRAAAHAAVLPAAGCAAAVDTGPDCGVRSGTACGGGTACGRHAGRVRCVPARCA